MKTPDRTLRLAILTIAVIVLNGCTPSPTAVATVEIPTSTLALPTATAVPSTPTSTPTSIPQGKTIQVTSPADAGPGTLREALVEAQIADTIIFDPTVFPPDVPEAIPLTSALPPITQGYLTIDASDAGVILDGSAVGGDMDPGLNIQADGVKVHGMQIVGFSGCGIELRGQENTIGGNRETGSGPLGQGNLLSNNDGGLCLYDGADSNTVRGNLIGVDAAGLGAWGNQRNGVQIVGGRQNLIEENVLSGHSGRGIEICCSSNSADNTVMNNLIGVGSDGHTPIPNGDTGISLSDGANHNTIGPGNIIANPAGSYGIAVQRGFAPGNTILGNSIYNNLGSGISLWNENTDLARVPAIVTFDLAAGVVTGVGCPNCLIQIYSDEDNEGQVFEGQATADAEGVFSFSKGSPLTGPHLTATATDAEGTTSMFSVPTVGASSSTLQEDNPNPFSHLEILHADQLPDNRIGYLVQAQDWVDSGLVDANVLNGMGVKRARGAMNVGDSSLIVREADEFLIQENFDQMITGLEENGIRMIYVLIFWDNEHYRQTGQTISPRFQTEEEIQRWLDFVRHIVRSFGDRVDYWELWNEPHGYSTPYTFPVETFIDVGKRVIAVIREEDPGAKIVVPSYHGWDPGLYD